MPDHRDDLARVNHAIGVDWGGPDPEPDPDPDEPRDDPHASHAWTPHERWHTCSRCGVRDHWRAAETRCRVPASKTTAVSLADALAAILDDLAAFRAWWAAGDHPDPLPSVDEWAANFHEWRIAR